MLSDYINNFFPHFTLIFADRFVTLLSSGFAFCISEYRIYSTNNLPPTASSCTAECYAIIESLLLIPSLTPDKFSIATEFRSSPPGLKYFKIALLSTDYQYRTSLLYRGHSIGSFSFSGCPATLGFR